MKEVWICDPNYHNVGEILLLVSLRFINVFRSYIKYSEEWHAVAIVIYIISLINYARILIGSH